MNSACQLSLVLELNEDNIKSDLGCNSPGYNLCSIGPSDTIGTIHNGHGETQTGLLAIAAPSFPTCGLAYSEQLAELTRQAVIRADACRGIDGPVPLRS